MRDASLGGLIALAAYEADRFELGCGGYTHDDLIARLEECLALVRADKAMREEAWESRRRLELDEQLRRIQRDLAANG